MPHLNNLMIHIQGHNTYDPLSVCMVGRTYSPDQFAHIQDPTVRDRLQLILHETEEDYLNLCRVLRDAGVEVVRPDQPQGDWSQRPPCQPRDDMAVVGPVLHVNHARPEYRTILNQCSTVVEVPPCAESRLISTSFIHRVQGTLHWGTNQPQWRHSQLVESYTQQWQAAGWSVDVMANEGHGDCTWCVPCEGCIITLHDVSRAYYESQFPGWDILYVEDKYWHHMSPFRRIKQQNGGRWWVPGAEDELAFGAFVNTYLKEWVGYVEETVFEVNMLSLSPDVILVNNYHKEVFDFLERHHVTPVIVPFRHRWFWDGGVHCVTQDLRREHHTT